MLRSFVLGFGIFLLGCGVLAVIGHGYPSAVASLIWGALIVCGIVFERVRYKPLETSIPPGNWVRTGERFIDEESGAAVTVWLDPETGERKYVKD
jgi:hypothetical protein